MVSVFDFLDTARGLKAMKLFLGFARRGREMDISQDKAVVSWEASLPESRLTPGRDVLESLATQHDLKCGGHADGLTLNLVSLLVLVVIVVVIVVRHIAERAIASR